jgi:hypothetical protein
MFSVFWLFSGFLVGLLIAVVFTPPLRTNPQVPTPHDDEIIHTETGCVKFKTREVPCTAQTSSLNFIASQHK